MAMFRRLTALAAAAEAARRYAQRNPEQATRMAEQAASFIDKRTKGRYRGQLDGAVRGVRRATGIPPAGR